MKRKITIIIISLITAMLFCIPYFNLEINMGADTAFHMNRIESILVSIKNGNIYPYVFPNQNFNFGYASPIFYSTIMYYPLVMLRMIGVSVFWTWIIAVFVIVFFSSVSILYCLNEFKKDPSIIAMMICSYLYMCESVLWAKIIKRGALLEFMVMIFLPLLLVVIKRVIKDKKDCWVYLGIIFSLLFLTHNLTFVAAAIMFAIVIIFNIKDIFKHKLYLTIIKGTLLALLLTAFYYFPMLEQMSIGIYDINNYFDGRLEGVVNVIEYIKPWEGIFFIEHSMQASLLILPLFLIKKKEYRFLIIGGYLSLFFTLDIVWKILNTGSFFQFANRFLVFTVTFLSIAVGVVIDEFKKQKNLNLIICLITLVGILSNIYLMDIYLNKYEGFIVPSTTANDIRDDEKWYDWNLFYNVCELSTPDYLPSNRIIHYRDYYKNIYPFNDWAYTNVGVERYFECVEYEFLDLEIPKTYYKGYKATIFDSNGYVETIVPSYNDAGLQTLKLPESYIGNTINVVIEYNGTKVQKITALVSGLSALTLTCYIVFVKQKEDQLFK